MSTQPSTHPSFDYFYGNEHEQYLYLQIPIALIKDPLFKPLSGDAKLLYGLLLNRTSLSIRNGWRDDQNRVYIIYTIDEIMTDLNCWESKANKSMKELTALGLVKSIRRGLGKPNLLYVMNFATAIKPGKPTENAAPMATEIEKTDPIPERIPESRVESLICENRNSGIAKNANQELRKSQLWNCENRKQVIFNKNYIYYRELDPVTSVCVSESELDPPPTETEKDRPTGQDETSYLASLHTVPKKAQKKEEPVPHRSPQKNKLPTGDDYTQVEAKIKTQILYDQLMKDYRFKQKEIEELTNIMIDVYMTTEPTLRIDGETKPRSLVLGVYDKVRYEHIIHTIEQFDSQNIPIARKKRYLITTLFNAVHEMTSCNNNRFNTGEFT